jgi:arylsulfatase A-like enzyme
LYVTSRRRDGLIAVAILSAIACSDRAPERLPLPAPGTSASPGPKASARAGLATERALIDEAFRAELDVDGLAIDLGTPDQHKYVRGGWRTGWGDRGETGGATWLALRARSGWLDMPAPAQAPDAIVVRARSAVAGQTLSFLIDGRELGTVELAPEWREARVAVAAGAWPSGRARLEVRAAAGASSRPRAELDWLWLAAGAAGPALGPRVAPVTIDGVTRRALVAATPRTYAFHVQPPPGARLVLDLGAEGRGELAVTVTADGGERAELLREHVEGRWVERSVSLERYAGRPVRVELASRDHRGLAGWGEPEIAVAPPAATPATRLPPPRNVIVLVMDTARADAFGPFATPDRVVRTPSFDAFAARCAVFTAAYNNENWTKPSVASLLSALYPSTHGAKRDESELSRDVELLPERLRRDGFATAGFVANGYVSEKFGFEQGWDTFRNYIREDRRSEAEHVFADALDWLDDHRESPGSRPFFLYLQTIDPHVTYKVDKAYWSPYFAGDYRGQLGTTIDAADQVALSTGKRKATARDLAWLRALYHGEIAYHDDHLGRFVAQLDARGVLADTLVVITNDHGEELGERGRFGHGHQVFEELVRAPLVLYHPGLAGGRTVREIVEHVDVAPTILDALGREPLAAAEGVSVLPVVTGGRLPRPRYAVIEFLEDRRVIRIADWKLVARARGEVALFDLATDPQERRDLAAERPIARRLAELHLGEALAVPAKAQRDAGLGERHRYQAGEADIDPHMRRQLEALGYLGSSEPAEASGDD